MTEQRDDRPDPGGPAGAAADVGGSPNADGTAREDGPTSGDGTAREDGSTSGDGTTIGDGAASADGPDRGAADGRAPDEPGDRYVDVPMRLYKTVTVFSTLIAVVAILLGFVLLDRGTQRATAGPEEVSLPLVLAGLAFIVAGSAVYAFSTRFRAEGMGKDKDDTGERSNDG